MLTEFERRRVLGDGPHQIVRETLFPGRADLKSNVDVCVDEPGEVLDDLVRYQAGVPRHSCRVELDRAGARTAAREVVFRGADSGRIGDRDGVRYERSLTVADAGDCDGLLAYAMNGEPLPLRHGYPVRLVVPRWYGMTSVKWLTHLDLVGEPFDGHFQTNAYFYEWEADDAIAREPLSLQNVRCLITEPAEGDDIDRGDIAIRGVAWSGAAAISRVEVSLADSTWQEARLLGERSRSSWQWWELVTRLEQPGTTTIRARATDLAGRTQPEEPRWNRLGYGNNAIQHTVVDVAPARSA